MADDWQKFAAEFNRRAPIKPFVHETQKFRTERQEARNRRLRGNIAEAAARLWGTTDYAILLSRITGRKPEWWAHALTITPKREEVIEACLALQAHITGIREYLAETESLVREAHALSSALVYDGARQSRHPAKRQLKVDSSVGPIDLSPPYTPPVWRKERNHGVGPGRKSTVT